MAMITWLNIPRKYIFSHIPVPIPVQVGFFESDCESGGETLTAKNRGILHSLHSMDKHSRKGLSKKAPPQNKEKRVLELKRSGNYLAFLDEGDPIYLSREMMEWVRERQEPESFIKRLTRQFKKNQ